MSSATTVSPEATSPTPGLRHILYPYSGPEQYLTGTLAYIEHARTDGAAVLVAAPEPRRELLRPHLPDDHAVTFLDTAALGRNPGRLIPAWQEWIGTHCRDGREVHGISEPVWSGRSAAHLSELRYHEWLLNRAFAAAPAWSLLCPYDTTDQLPAAVQALGQLHPWVWDGAAQTSGVDYADAPYVFEPLGEPCDPFDEVPFTSGGLAALRGKVAHCARANHLPENQLRDLLLAVTEIAANSIRHGGGGGTMRVWAQEGALVCELRDQGVITDPMLGRIRPAADRPGGRGLWFAHQLCDLVEIRSAPGDGTCVRLHMDLPEPAKPDSHPDSHLGSNPDPKPGPGPDAAENNE